MKTKSPHKFVIVSTGKLKEQEPSEALRVRLLAYAKKTRPSFRASLSVRPEGGDEELQGVLAGQCVGQYPPHKRKLKHV